MSNHEPPASHDASVPPAPPYAQNAYPPPPTAATAIYPAVPPVAAPPRQPIGLALAALIVGVVAFFTGLVPVLGAILGAAAVVLGIMAIVRRQSKGLSITGVVLGGIAFLSSVAMTIGLSAAVSSIDAAPTELVESIAPVDDAVVEEEAVVEEPVVEEPTMVAVPSNLIGMTASDAANALTQAGLQPTYSGDAGARVVGINPADAVELEVGSPVTLLLEEKPALSVGQSNAIRSAESYLDYTGFSRSGLIGQLEFEGFSTEDATFAVDTIAPDWNAEAAEKAQSYIDYTSFSRQGLIDQLLFEGFSQAEAEFGAAAVGY